MSALNVFAVLPKPTNHSELHECIAAFSTSSTIKDLLILSLGYICTLRTIYVIYTGYFRKVYRSLQVLVPDSILNYVSIYPKVAAKSVLSVYLSIEFTRISYS